MTAEAVVTGERVVVFLFVARVIAAAPLSLAFESAGLALLTFAGLVLEISAEKSPSFFQRFRTRPGVSSGILLGTVTLPTVKLSRLVQLSRALSSHDIGSEEFAYTAVQYWAVSASCVGVLIFIHSVLRHNSSSKGSHPGSFGDSVYSLMYIVLYVFTCYMSFSAKLYSAGHAIVKILWLACHGVTTTYLLRHILETFPSCASIGEALLVSSGLVLYVSDILTHSLLKIDHIQLLSRAVFSEYGSRSEVSTIMQGLLLGLLIFPAFYNCIVRAWIHFKCRPAVQDDEAWRDTGISRSIIFYICLAVMLIIIVPSWMGFVQEFDTHPLLWVLNFVFSEPLKRLTLCIYWLCVICASVMRFYNISKNSKIERILLRKYYHLVAVIMFVPALLLQPNFLDLSFGAAFGAFLILEMIRVWKIWPLGHIINQFMSAFTDHRDSEILIISHFSLLLGCALPKWLSSEFNDRPLAPFAGILSLGIGDTMASMVGHKYGVLRWSKTGRKTIEGTAAGITSVLVACSVLLPLLASTGYILSQHWLSLLTAVTVSGLLEAYTAQLDNAFIPLVFYSLLCL